MKVSVLGLGIIGAVWARNLLADGIDVRTWNRTPKVFPGFQGSLPETIEGSDFIIVVVSDPPAVAAVLEQICPFLKGGQTLIQCSTISAKWTLEFAAQVNATGASFLEAPFTGSKPAALQRKTVFYVGGDKEVLDMSQAVLERLSTAILHIGPLGTASSLKLSMNLNIAGVAQALCESLSLCRAAGVTDDVYFKALSMNAAHSGLAALKEPKLRDEDFSPQFALKHMLKDLRLAAETGKSFDVDLPLNQQVIKLYESAVQRGWSEEDFIGLVRLNR